MKRGREHDAGWRRVDRALLLFGGDSRVNGVKRRSVAKARVGEFECYQSGVVDQNDARMRHAVTLIAWFVVVISNTESIHMFRINVLEQREPQTIVLMKIRQLLAAVISHRRDVEAECLETILP